MLTQSEREWLEDRRRVAYCRYCNVSRLCANPFASGFSCQLTGNMKDAAEFSERVAGKLAAWDHGYHKEAKLCPHYDVDLDDYIPLCQCEEFCENHPQLGCIEARLAWVRIKVEEEMNVRD